MEVLLANKKPNFVWVTENNISSEWISSEYYDPKFIEIEKKFLSNRFDIYYFNEIADINRVSGFEVEKYLEIVTNGVPYLRVKNIAECFVEHEDLYHIPQYVHQKFKQSQFKKNDIAMTITGRVGTAALINDETTEYNASQDVVKISLKKGGIDPYYLTIYLNSRINHSLLSRFNSGGSRQRTLINNVREVKIPIPSPEIQKYIGDKVRKAEELREEAKRLKKEGQKILNEELYISQLKETLNSKGKKYDWINKQNLSDRIDSEFYKGKFLLNNIHLKKLNSLGVEIKKLSEIIHNGSYGILPSSSDYGNGDIELLRSTNIQDFIIDSSKIINVPEKYYKDKVKVSNGEILLEIKGQCIAGAIAENIENRTIVNGSIFKFSVKDEFYNYYILAYLLSESGQLQKKQNLANSIISYLSIDSINSLMIPILDTEKQKKIGRNYRMYVQKDMEVKQLIQEAKKDVEDLIEGNFDMSKLNQS